MNFKVTFTLRLVMNAYVLGLQYRVRDTIAHMIIMITPCVILYNTHSLLLKIMCVVITLI
jgi:hypothetical protein